MRAISRSWCRYRRDRPRKLDDGTRGLTKPLLSFACFFGALQKVLKLQAAKEAK